MVNEQTERELRTTQDLLHQTEAEVASVLDRVSELNDELHKRGCELKEARQEKNCIKTNLTRLDKEKDALLVSENVLHRNFSTSTWVSTNLTALKFIQVSIVY